MTTVEISQEKLDEFQAMQDDFNRLRRYMEEHARPALDKAGGDPVKAIIDTLDSARALVEALLPTVRNMIATAKMAMERAGLVPSQVGSDPVHDRLDGSSQPS